MRQAIKQHKRTVAMGSVVSLLSASWSWMFGLRITDLTDSLFVGYLSAWMAFLVIVGLSAVLFLVIIRYFAREYSRHEAVGPWFLLRLFVGWAAVEFVIAHIVAVVWIGRNGSLDTILPFGSFTPLLAYTPLSYLARFIGFYGLSAVFVVLLSTAVFKKLRRYVLPVVVLVLVTTGSAWLLYRSPDGPDMDAQIVATGREGVESALASTSTLVVFPEYGLQAVDERTGIHPLLQTDEREVFYVGSKLVRVPKGTENTLVFGSTNKGVIKQQAKTRLIPGGEYMPYATEIPLKLLGAQHTLHKFYDTEEIQKGPGRTHPLAIADGVRLGSGVCASIISPDDYRWFTRQGATVFTNSASLAIFNSPIFTFQHEGLARFMAVANARPFLQSTTGGNAFALDHQGHLLKKVRPVGSDVMLIRANRKITPYTLLGEWVAYAGLAMFAIYLFKYFKRAFIKHA